MEKKNIMDLKLEENKPFILAIPSHDNVSAEINEALEYFANDSSITVINTSGLHSDGIFHALEAPCTTPYKVIVFITDCAAINRVTEKDIPVHIIDFGSEDANAELESLLQPGAVLVESKYETLRNHILALFGWAKFPVFDEDKARLLKSSMWLEYSEHIRKGINNGNVDVGLDSHGHAIARTTSRVIDCVDTDNTVALAQKMKVSIREAEYLAYVGLDFVTVPRKDARVCADLLDEIVEGYEGDDVEAFGDRGISYERLHDRLTGLIYLAHTRNHADVHDKDMEIPRTVNPAIDKEEWKSPGYHKSRGMMLIWEKDDGSTTSEWTPEEWKVLCKICGVDPENAERMVMHVSAIEVYNKDKEEK